MAFGSSIDQRKQNKRNHVVALFRQYGELSKALARQYSGYSMDTIIGLFKALEDEGYIAQIKKESDQEQSEVTLGGRGRGRPAELYRLQTGKEVYVGVTFNRSGFWTTLVGLDGHELDTRFDELPELGSQEELESRFEIHFEAFVQQNRDLMGAVKRVGLALPGRIDKERGLLARYNLMPFLSNLDLRPIVQRQLGAIEITVQHNITGLVSLLLQDKELTGSNQRILYISARSGAAHALIQDERIVLDDGEMGHITVSSSAKLCQCGRKGCLDTVFSAAEFHRLCPHSSWKQLASILKDDSPAATALRPIVEPPFEAFVEALMNLTAAFSPGAVILSGSLFSILPDPAAWISERIIAHCGDTLPPWIPSSIVYWETGAESAAVGLCRIMIDQDWPWAKEQTTQG